jgi:RHS repeat-associated protein
VPGVIDHEYRFSATQNNGRITQRKDWISGEEITYQHDALQRLISAETTGREWGQSFTFDGFGNLLQQTVTKGSAPSLSVLVDTATNHITTSGYAYDANGNLTAMPTLSSLVYDVDNRLITATHASNGTDQYRYDPSNRRVWKKKPDGTQETYFYGLDGRKLGTYSGGAAGTPFATVHTNVHFAGKLIWAEGAAAVTDRLRSVVSGNRKYFPYGEEPTTTGQDKTKFATYYRDGTTALDYAHQRYYARTIGRFLTADPYVTSGGTAVPGSWNRYAYVNGDPVNYIDPSGRDDCPPDDPCPVEPEDESLNDPWLLLWWWRFYVNQTAAEQQLYLFFTPPAVADPPSNKVGLSNASKSGPNQDTIIATLEYLLANLDDDCAAFLGGRAAAEGAIRSLIDTDGSSLIAHGVVTPTSITAFTGGRPSDFEDGALAAATQAIGAFAVMVNDNGAFFKGSTVNNGRLVGNSAPGQRFILLHELGHVLDVLEHDFNDSEAGRRNDDRINDHCSKTFHNQ